MTLFIKSEELKEKGMGVILDAVAKTKQFSNNVIAILENIEDVCTDAKVKRALNIQLEFTPNSSRTGLAIDVKTNSKLAPQTVMSLKFDLESAIDDEGQLVGYQLKEQSDQAEGQQTIDGEEVQREVITIPHKNDAIDAEFTEKGNEADTDEETLEDTETLEDEEYASNELLDSEETIYYDEVTGEVFDDSGLSDYEPDPVVPEYPGPDSVNDEYDF